MSKHNLRLDIKPNVIKNPNAPKHRIKTVNDLYQVATTKNINRLMRDLKNGIMLSLLMEDAVIEIAKSNNPNYVHKKVELQQFEWCDDTVKPQHA